jgi:hypothetical protein
MKEEYDKSFEKQFGSVDDDDGTFKPPTSSSYNKVSSILGNSSNVGSSISIETFHSITPIHGNMSELSNRNRSQRVPQLQVSVQEMSDYRRNYQDLSADSRRQGVIQSFWSEVVYPKALVIWNQQKVMMMNEADNITNSSTILNDDKLTFRGLTKQNRKDAWGSDKLGNQEDDDDEMEEEE